MNKTLKTATTRTGNSVWKRYNKGGGSSLISATTQELKVYVNYCISCTEAERYGVMYYYAKKYGLKINMRRVYVFPELQAEADVFGEPMPFIELNGKTLDFFAIGKNMLEDEILDNFINEAKNESNN